MLHLLLFFSHSEGCLFTLLIFSFAVQKLLSLIRSHLFTFVCISITLGGGSQRILLWFMSSSVLPMFSSKSFIVSGFTFRSLIHFEFIYVYCVRKCSKFILLHVTVQFSQHHLLKRLCWRRCREKVALLHCWWNINWYSHYGRQYEDSLKKNKQTRNKTTIWPRNPSPTLRKQKLKKAHVSHYALKHYLQ